MPAEPFVDPPERTRTPAPISVAITVVVVNWNRRNLLAACLDSLARQSWRDFEVVVVDNGSSDGSVALVKALSPSYRVPLHLIENSNNRGFCAANNQGFAASRSELVALLNNDAEAEPGWLAALERVIRSSEDMGMAALAQWHPRRRESDMRMRPITSNKTSANSPASSTGSYFMNCS